MALNAYLRLTGSSSGAIDGDVTQAGREGSILVIAHTHGVTGNGARRTGPPTHMPLTITKEIDSSTPLLATMWGDDELITDFRLEFYRPSRSGKEEQYFTIELSGAKVAAIRTEMLNNKYPENMQHHVREHVSFTYERIVQTIEVGGVITSELEWA